MRRPAAINVNGKRLHFLTAWFTLVLFQACWNKNNGFTLAFAQQPQAPITSRGGGVRKLPVRPAVLPNNMNNEEQTTPAVPEHPTPNDTQSKKKEEAASASSSKRTMLRFALPALGIYLTNPLMSNVDNAFVGRMAGTQALAAMSPGTTLSDFLLMMFSFLGRATTGIVSRAYGKDRDTQAASKAASAPFTMALICGIFLTMVYEFLTPKMLAKLGANPVLRPQATSYIYWRGSVAWAALIQTACLSCLLVTRDSLTPLKIVGVAALVNVLGDALFCVWPLQLGCAGAAAATAVSTLFSCSLMLRALKKKNIWPSLKIPTRQELLALLQFTGPLMAITLTRIGGFFAMQKRAAKLGMQSLAGYQLCIHIMMFFLLFGEPLSQLSQTKLPTLVDEGNRSAVLETLQSAMSIAGTTALAVASIAFMAARFASKAISPDLAVQHIAQSTAPVLFITIGTAIISVAFDGAQIAAKDFGYMLIAGFATFLMQLKLLPHCTTIAQIFATFAMRMGLYAAMSVVRAALGYGGLGKVLRRPKMESAPIARNRL